MRTACVLSTWNEADFIRWKINWARNNGVELYVCDNMSDDGTWEILQKEGIRCHQYDTRGIFSEHLMQAEVRQAMDALRPDWMIYNGADLFPIISGGIRAACNRADSIDANVIRLKFLSARYTGEDRQPGELPFLKYTHCHDDGYLDFIFRWHKDIRLNGDSVEFPYEKRVLIPDGLMINYGDTKTKERRLATLMRKQKAWNDLGENPGLGEHLRAGFERGWLWDKKELQNIWKDSDYRRLLRQLIWEARGC